MGQVTYFDTFQTLIPSTTAQDRCAGYAVFFTTKARKNTKLLATEDTDCTEVSEAGSTLRFVSGSFARQTARRVNVLNAAFAPNTICAQGPRFDHKANYIVLIYKLSETTKRS
jgi:hypothetical protein